MLQLKGLVGKHPIVNACIASSVVVNEISCLDHEIFDNAMKGNTFVTKRDALRLVFTLEIIN